jgi:hypothetical protein
LDHGEERMLGAPSRLEQRRKVGARPELRNRQLYRAHPRVPGSRPVPVAVRRALATALVSLGANESGDLALHQRLGQDANALAQHVPVLLLEQLANKRVQIILALAIVIRPPCVLFWPKNSRNDVRWPLRLSSAGRLPNFHHVRGL